MGDTRVVVWIGGFGDERLNKGFAMKQGVIGLRAVVVWVLLFGVMYFGSGCETALRDLAFHAPNKGKTFEREAGVLHDAPWYHDADYELFVGVGPPDATLRMFIIEPRFEDEGSGGAAGVDATGSVDAVRRAKGTLLVLHGYRIDSDWVMHTGHMLADAGYRAVMVDLRGHGGSEGDYVTFGSQESRDLVRVTDELERLGLIEGKLGVWGVSMGAATAIQYAGRDERVKAVVAVAPYASLKEIVPTVMRHLVVGLAMDDEAMARMIDSAAEEGGFDPDDANTVAAAQRTDAPILILHGEWDFIVPFEQGLAIHEGSPGNTELVRLGYAGHALAHVAAAFGDRSTGWFDRHLVDAK